MLVGFEYCCFMLIWLSVLLCYLIVVWVGWCLLGIDCVWFVLLLVICCLFRIGWFGFDGSLRFLVCFDCLYGALFSACLLCWFVFVKGWVLVCWFVVLILAFVWLGGLFISWCLSVCLFCGLIGISFILSLVLFDIGLFVWVYGFIVCLFEFVWFVYDVVIICLVWVLMFDCCGVVLW